MLVNLKEILEIAERDNIAIGMFNATGFDSLQAVIAAAEELNQPVIIAHAEVHNVYNDISIVGPAMVAAAKNAKVPVCVHLDHGVSMEMIYRALRIGFTSVMIDASALPYEENLALTKQVVEMSHAMGVSVEAELGRLVTGEAGSKEEVDTTMKAEDFYTDPVEAEAFCKETGVDALAIAFGTAHGFYNAQPKLDFDVVKNVAAATGLPLVMHGGSGVSEEGFKKAIGNGIRKVNYYSYMSKAGYEAAKAEIEAGNSSYLHDVEFAAMKAMKEDVKAAIKVFANL
ncbi:MAG: class II fructose-bisphosphate aldolase [Clostridia bacterium]|nr:class II fructose-bisphosphate aldolase [Clostridia bacterium]MBQ5742864.1 class II fructose-bisphosphate aldolase [Clostridia bacterium]